MLPLTLSASVMSLMLAAGTAQAGARLVYTHHALVVDVRDLDPNRAADRQILQTRIADAADEVCGGRPDRDGVYDKRELSLLVPAYEKCRGDAIARASEFLKVPAQKVAGK